MLLGQHLASQRRTDSAQGCVEEAGAGGATRVFVTTGLGSNGDGMKNRVVMITGASSGTGEALAGQLAQRRVGGPRGLAQRVLAGRG